MSLGLLHTHSYIEHCHKHVRILILLRKVVNVVCESLVDELLSVAVEQFILTQYGDGEVLSTQLDGYLKLIAYFHDSASLFVGWLCLWA